MFLSWRKSPRSFASVVSFAISRLALSPPLLFRKVLLLNVSRVDSMVGDKGGDVKSALMTQQGLQAGGV